MSDNGTRHGCAPNPDGSCSICGDVALAADVVAVNEAAAVAEVLIGGEPAVVALDLVDDVRPGDVLMVHLGFAIARQEGPS